MSSPKFLTRRRTAQAVVWLFALLLAAFVVLSGYQPPTTDSVPQRADYLADGALAAPAVYDNVGSVDAAAAEKWAKAAESSETHWLPAYRWSDALNVKSDVSSSFWEPFAGIETQVMNALTSFMFNLAGAVWALLLGITRWAFNTDLVEMASTEIQAMSTGLASSIGASGIVWVVVLMLAISVAGAILGGKKSGGAQSAIRNVALFAIPIALLQMLALNPDPVEGSQAWKLSPIGLAEQGSEVVNDVVATVTTPLASQPLKASQNGGVEDAPNCEYYYARLYATYRASIAEENDDHEAALMLVSKAWEASLLRDFTKAQYGVYDEGRYAVCHQLENQARISPQEQYDVAYGKRSPYAQMTADRDNPVFGVAEENKHEAAYNFAWMACRDKDGDAWKNVRDGDGDDGDRLDSDNCADWWSEGFDNDTGRFSPDEDALTFDNDEGPGQKTGGTGTMEYEVVTSYSLGEGRFSAAFFALIASLGYMLVLGAGAAGTIVATIALAGLLLFAPVTLLLLALPGNNGRRNQAGMKMLRSTGWMIAAKALMLTAITVAVILLNLVNTLFESLGWG